MTLRDATQLKGFLHGRWRDMAVGSFFLNIRLNGTGSEDERGRLVQPIDVLDHTSDGLWLPRACQEDEDGNTVPWELRCYPTGLGELKDIILDHPGGVGSTIYRIGLKERAYIDKKGKKQKTKGLTITDRWDTAQRSLPPTPTTGQPALGAPPAGGPNSQSLSQGCAQPTTPPAAAGPISPPSAQPVCPECGQPAARFKDMWVHCGKEVRA